MPRVRSRSLADGKIRNRGIVVVEPTIRVAES